MRWTRPSFSGGWWKPLIGSRPNRRDRRRTHRGFLLLEALVASAVVLGFIGSMILSLDGVGAYRRGLDRSIERRRAVESAAVVMGVISRADQTSDTLRLTARSLEAKTETQTDTEWRLIEITAWRNGEPLLRRRRAVRGPD